MSKSTEREAVANAYPGDSWKERVKKMSDSQVFALYIRLKQQGRIR